MKRYEIIVSQCTPDGSSIYGPSCRTTEEFSGDDSVKLFTKGFPKPGLSVILRPCHLDDDGKLYEFRSFNGEPYRRVDFGG